MKYWKTTIQIPHDLLENMTGALLAAGFDMFEVQDPRDVGEVLEKEHDYDYD